MKVMIGIDPHKATHTAVAIDNNEMMLDELRVRACSSQVKRLTLWAVPFEDRVWAIESARGLGYLLAQQLVAAGETVIDVPAALSTRTRLLGSGRAQKNDPNDARSVAITAMRVDGLQRVTADDHAQVLKLLAKRHRDLGQLQEQSSVSAPCAADGTPAGRDGQGNDREQGKRTCWTRSSTTARSPSIASRSPASSSLMSPTTKPR